MVAVKAHQANQFLKSPDPSLHAFLFFGTDTGLVGERAAMLARKCADSDNPPSEILRFDDADLEEDNSRLAVELQTMPMFGGRKIIRATTGRRINALLLKPLITEGQIAGILIVEAGNLKPDDSLRALFEKLPTTAAIGCYPDDAQDLSGVVNEILSAARMTISPVAQQLLVAKLGADRALSRGEIEKLVLYSQGKSAIDEDDVEAIVGDASELTIDRVALAAASGDSARSINEFARAVASGENPQLVIVALHRHFQRLHRVRAGMDAGRSLDDGLRTIRPPLNFKQKDAFAAQCRMWSTERLSRAISGIAAGAKAARTAGALETSIAERLLLSVARLARDSRQPAGAR